MSDQTVSEALRSNAQLVVVEAAAGCGKTYQAADYAGDVSFNGGYGRLLIVTHTHAACDVFAQRTEHVKARVEIRTIDSLIGQVAGAYHLCLGLPSDVGAWARARNDGYATLAAKVALLLAHAPMIAAALAKRYPIVICDEHQDSSIHQHNVVMSLLRAGSQLRVLGDPMQSIYGNEKERKQREQQWTDLVAAADRAETLEYPHRWKGAGKALGEWVQDARRSLMQGEQLDLSRTLPPSVQVIRAENAATGFGQYRVDNEERRPIDAAIEGDGSTLVLAAHNATVNALCPFFNRRLPMWEGHVRNYLDSFASAIAGSTGSARDLAAAMTQFLGKVAVGFSPSVYGNRLLEEIDSGCVGKRRGKPEAVRQIAKMMLDSPDHVGVSRALKQVETLSARDPRFKDIKIDHRREFHDAIAVCEHSDPQAAVSELSRKRTFACPSPPPKAISTIHKAKGLEVDRVVVMPCDRRHFGDKSYHRNLFYVAISRAKRAVTLVVPCRDLTPLLRIDQAPASQAPRRATRAASAFRERRREAPII